MIYGALNIRWIIVAFRSRRNRHPKSPLDGEEHCTRQERWSQEYADRIVAVPVHGENENENDRVNDKQKGDIENKRFDTIGQVKTRRRAEQRRT